MRFTSTTSSGTRRQCAHDKSRAAIPPVRLWCLVIAADRLTQAAHGTREMDWLAARGGLFHWYHEFRGLPPKRPMRKCEGVSTRCLQDISLSGPRRVNAVRFARDVSQTGAPGEIPTPDPQIRVWCPHYPALDRCSVDFQMTTAFNSFRRVIRSESARFFRSRTVQSSDPM